VAIALVTTYLTDYRMPLFARLAERHRVEVFCSGGGERYVPAWFSDLDAQLRAAPFPARRLGGLSEALDLGRHYDAIIAPFAGGALLPASYVGARRHRRPFVLWASVWSQPRSLAHASALPVTRHIYRHADAVVAYGEHVRRFVAGVRGRDDDVFVAPQSVEPELFGREVRAAEIEAFRARHRLGPGPVVIFVGRLVPEKGAGILLEAWSQMRSDATLVVVGDGPCAASFRGVERVHLLGPLPRPELPVAYAAALATVVPSVPTPRFREPWGLVCNESMHQGRPVVASASVGAAAGGLVRDGQTGLIVPPRDPTALAGAIDRLATDEALRARLGAAARAAVADYTYDAMAQAFDLALARAFSRRSLPD
jgi:glycosyltransferase involved in cell wall biosynthesis